MTVKAKMKIIIVNTKIRFQDLMVLNLKWKNKTEASLIGNLIPVSVQILVQMNQDIQKL